MPPIAVKAIPPERTRIFSPVLSSPATGLPRCSDGITSAAVQPDALDLSRKAPAAGGFAR